MLRSIWYTEHMKKLYRSSQDKYLFGILGGLGEYLNTDATLLRLLFVFFVLITGFFPGVLAYLIAVFIVPEDPHELHIIRNKKHHNQEDHHEEAHSSDSATTDTDSKASYSDKNAA